MVGVIGSSFIVFFPSSFVLYIGVTLITLGGGERLMYS